MFSVKRFSAKKIILGTSIGSAAVFMLLGVIFWGGFNTAMEATNSMVFCVSCHEMEENVYQEYKQTIHYKNRVGVRAICSDCHVPDPWVHKFVRKIKASNELFHAIIGTIDTPEKFEEKRLELAQHVWETMKETDSRECRNCHSFDSMDANTQKSRSAQVHKYSQQRNKTCIDCHKGIAHHLPDSIEPYRGGDDNDHEFYEKMNLVCYQCHQDMPKPNDDWDED